MSSLLELHAARPERYPVLLETVARNTRTPGHDILFAFPGEHLVLDRDGVLSTDAELNVDRGFLASLDEWWTRERCETRPLNLPFSGGWFLYLGYELAREIEPTLPFAPPAVGPIARAVRMPAAIVHTHATNEYRIVSEVPELAEQIEADLAGAGAANVAAKTLAGPHVEDAPERFIRIVEEALEHIAAGDVYQANLSREWRAQLEPDVRPHHVYARLRAENPAPFAALAVFDQHAIVSSSPERLLEVRDGWASTRPIAGTRPRSMSPAMDLGLARELAQHPKERAEHIMLIDLERNDLGRICAAGSVEVDEYMTLETYAHVHHIVSNVRGRLRSDVTPGAAIRALFPGGTITGCPKVRCMHLISELEGSARGAYTGSLGYLNRDGSLDLNILIRTLEINGTQVRFRAGAGIVADSDPLRELEETQAKARGLVNALSPPDFEFTAV